MKKLTRIVAIFITLAMVIILPVAFLSQLVLAMYSQTWYITDTASGANYIMNRGSASGGSTAITVTKGSSVIWEANESASLAVSFAAGNWTGQISATPDWDSHEANVEIGYWNGTSFTSAGTSGTMTFPIKGALSTQPFTITASSFTVTAGDWLALRFNNLVPNKFIIVQTDSTSYVISPSTDPGYPSPWESYNDSGHTTVDNNFGAGEETVYMFGEGFKANSDNYSVAYYDGSETFGGLKIATDTGLLSTAQGSLSSHYNFPSNPSATIGTWHAVVFDTEFGSPPTYYDDAAAAAGYVVEDSFDVTAGAIPEFSTVFAAIGIAGLCFGIYYWMRRRYQRQAVMA